MAKLSKYFKNKKEPKNITILRKKYSSYASLPAEYIEGLEKIRKIIKGVRAT